MISIISRLLKMHAYHEYQISFLPFLFFSQQKKREFSAHGAYPVLLFNKLILFSCYDIFAGFSYKAVALHEMGHSLGFAHSDVPSAVMYAYYGPQRHTLTADDIAGAEALFGPA